MFHKTVLMTFSE